MSHIKIKSHTSLAEYFSKQPLYLDKDEKKPNTRKVVEQPFQQTKAEMWDEVVNTLCSLEFIQAKASAKMTYYLVKDINIVLEEIPDNASNLLEENKCQARLEKYTDDLIAFAKGEISVLDIPETFPLKSSEELDSEIERMKTNPTRLDCLKDFKNFLGQEASNLHKYAFEYNNFAKQQAWNYADSGPVANEAEKELSRKNEVLLLLNPATRPTWEPLPQIMLNLKGHQLAVSAVSITPNGKWAVSGSWDGTCILWNLTSGEAEKILKGHNGKIFTVSISPNGKRVISGSLDKTCILWNLETGEKLLTLEGHTSYIVSVAMSSDCFYAISCSNDGTCIVWDLNLGQAINVLKGQSNVITSMAVSSNFKTAILSSIDGSTIIWNFKLGQATIILKAKTDDVVSVAILPNGEKAITCSSDSTFVIWNLNLGNPINIYKGEIGDLLSVAVTPDGKKAISSHSGGICVLWDLCTERMINFFKGTTIDILSLAITPDGRRAISGNNDGSCTFRDLSGRNTMDLMHGELNRLNMIDTYAFTHDGKMHITAYSDYCIIWDLQTGRKLNILDGHKNSINAISITPDDNRVITASNDGTCIIWNLKTKEKIFSLKEMGSIYALAISSDGRIVISGGEGNTCNVWNLESGELIKTLEGHTSSVKAIAITPDGKIAVSGSSDNTCIIWNLDTGQKIRSLIGHTSQIKAVAISSDGKMVISGSADKNCILWNLRTGEKLRTLKEHTEIVNSVCFTPDNQRVISTDFWGDSNVVVWNLGRGEKECLFIPNSSRNTVKWFHGNIFVIGDSARVYSLKLHRALQDSFRTIVTIRQIWDFELEQFLPLSVDCPLCGSRFEPALTVVSTIKSIREKINLKSEQSPCLELSQAIWEDPRLLGNCPECEGTVKYNPFIVGEQTEILSSQLQLCPRCGSKNVNYFVDFDQCICKECNCWFFCQVKSEQYKYLLNLVDYRLAEIPEWVFRKQYLKKLDLSAEPYDSFHASTCNRISVVSPQIGMLTDLEDLDLTYNEVLEIPPEIGDCRKLSYLSFAQNQLREIPSEIEKLEKLDILNLYHNQIEFLPIQISGLRSLTQLHIDSNKIISLPNEIGKLSNLKVLRAEKNRIMKLPEEICYLTSLEILHLQENILETLPDEIGSLKNLRMLNLANNKLISLPVSIINLISLEEFIISGNLGLVSPPYQIAIRGIQAIKAWFAENKRI